MLIYPVIRHQILQFTEKMRSFIEDFSLDYSKYQIIIKLEEIPPKSKITASLC
jgi:hypothetical protein